MRSRSDFASRKPNRFRDDVWYDVSYDAELIEQSLAKQYGVLPAAQAELPYWEWARLVEGLMDDTPLGRVVAVRSERDREKIKAFSPWQRKIRAEWRAFQVEHIAARVDKTEWSKQMAALERMMAKAFGKEGGVVNG